MDLSSSADHVGIGLCEMRKFSAILLSGAATQAKPETVYLDHCMDRFTGWLLFEELLTPYVCVYGAVEHVVDSKGGWVAKARTFVF